MKRIIFVPLFVAACDPSSLGGPCNLSGYDALVGQNVSVLDQQADRGDFVIVKSGEVWTESSATGKTLVFLGPDRTIISFGCG